MPSREREHHPENESRAYFKCARFADGQSAGDTYAALQSTIFDSQSDLSCFRFQLNAIWHNAVLGEPPVPELAEQLEALLARGEPASLPNDVLRQLQARRAQAIGSGASWIERHYREPRNG